MPLGPLTGSKPAGSAEKAAFNTPPRRGTPAAASARDANMLRRLSAATSEIPSAAARRRNSRRLRVPLRSASTRLANPSCLLLSPHPEERHDRADHLSTDLPQRLQQHN